MQNPRKTRVRAGSGTLFLMLSRFAHASLESCFTPFAPSFDFSPSFGRHIKPELRSFAENVGCRPRQFTRATTSS